MKRNFPFAHEALFKPLAYLGNEKVYDSPTHHALWLMQIPSWCAQLPPHILTWFISLYWSKHPLWICSFFDLWCEFHTAQFDSLYPQKAHYIALYLNGIIAGWSVHISDLVSPYHSIERQYTARDKLPIAHAHACWCASTPS